MYKRQVWALEADQDNEFWSEAAKASRKHFKEATNASTGLGPDYSEYSGAEKKEGNHNDFRFDAWRTAANIACDYAWWAKDDWAVTHANRLQSFFYDKGVESYGNQWALDGSKEHSTDHSPGLEMCIRDSPSMGAEELEDAEMEPFMAELESKISGKKIALFGSYGWGGGEWMRDWEARIQSAGATVVNGEGIIVNGEPDDDIIEELKALGKALV